MMLLAGDIGGTKSRLALFAEGGGVRTPLVEEVLPSGRFAGVEPLIREFIKRSTLAADRACLAIAGPVIDGRVAVTNLPWIADAESIRRAFGFKSVRLLNDLAATARAVPLLEADEYLALNAAEPTGDDTIAVIAPGTGLGEAFLTWDGQGYREHASEGGHADFAPTTPLEMDLLREHRRKADHVSYEHLCSGPGFGRLYRFLRKREGQGGVPEPEWLAEQLAGADEAGPVIVAAALERREPVCLKTVRLFVSILGAEAGNLALKTLSTGGVWLGGGIVPQILPCLEEEAFLEAFHRKGRMADLLFRMPVRVILAPRAALIGAADRGLADEGAEK
jgi:glucokinase